MARYEITQRLTGQSWVERSVRVAVGGGGWLAAREKLLFLMEEQGVAEDTDRAADAQTATTSEEFDSIMSETTVLDLVRSMIADTDDPPMIEPESGRWSKTFECYDMAWRTWEIRKL